MMPVWTPGYYVVEDCASRVRDLAAAAPDGTALGVSKPAPNRWEVTTNGVPPIHLTYALVAQGRSVTSNWVDAVSAASRNRSGNVVSFLLDAHIRRLTDGKRSKDDVMRRAYNRYGGERGFTADELRATVEEVTGRSMKAWFAKVIGSPGELDYAEMLGWYGLRFAGGSGASWDLEVRPKATNAQKRRLRALVTTSQPDS